MAVDIRAASSAYSFLKRQQKAHTYHSGLTATLIRAASAATANNKKGKLILTAIREGISMTSSLIRRAVVCAGIVALGLRSK
jgi:hypothetical protein